MSNKICLHCNHPLLRIDHYGEELIGCVDQAADKHKKPKLGPDGQGIPRRQSVDVNRYRPEPRGGETRRGEGTLFRISSGVAQTQCSPTDGCLGPDDCQVIAGGDAHEPWRSEAKRSRLTQG